MMGSPWYKYLPILLMVMPLFIGLGHGRADEIWIENIGLENTVSSLALTPDERWLISGGYDGTVRMWDLRHPGAMKFLLDHRVEVVDFVDVHPPLEVHAVAIDPQGHCVAAGSRDRTVRAWNLEKEGCPGSWQIPHLQPRASDAPDPRYTKPHALLRHYSRVLSVAFSPDSTLLAAGAGAPPILVWERGTGAPVHVLQEGFDENGRIKGAGLVHALAFTPDSHTLLSGDMDGVVSFWNLKTGQLDKRLELPCSFIYSLAISQPPMKVAAGCSGKAILWNEADESQTVLPHDDSNDVRSVAISADGEVLVTGDGGGTVRLWDLETGTERAHFLMDVGEVRSVLLSADQETVFAAGDGGYISIWKIKENTVYRLSGGER